MPTEFPVFLSPEPGAAQDVLWELSASLIDATAETAASVIGTAMSHLAEAIDAVSIGVWEVDETTTIGTAVHRWALDATFDTGDGFLAHPDPALREVLTSGDGQIVVGLHALVGAEVCAERGWGNQDSVVALIDFDERSSLVLVASSASTKWNEADLGLIDGVVRLLQQFHSRIRIEGRLDQRLALDALTLSLATRFQATTPDSLDDEITGALAEIGSIMNLGRVLIVDVVSDDTIVIPTLIDTPLLGPEHRTIVIPDVSKVVGDDGPGLREFVAVPRVFDLAKLVDSTLGPGTSEAFGLNEAPQTVALLPASVGHGESLLAVSRPGSCEWDETEFDALSTLASLIAQTRGRVSAERASSDLLDAQRTLVTIGRFFLEADASTADEAVHEALEHVARHLGADLAVIAAAGDDDDTMMVTDLWLACESIEVEQGARLCAEARARIEEFCESDDGPGVFLSSGVLVSDSVLGSEGDWKSVAAVISGAGLDATVLSFSWRNTERTDFAAAKDLAEAASDLIGQLYVRLRAENAVTTRLRMDGFLAEIAEDFLGASLEDADAAVDRAIVRLGRELELEGVVLCRAEPGAVAVEAVWAATGRRHPAVGHRISRDWLPSSPDCAGFEQVHRDRRWAAIVEDRWGPDVVVSGVPVTAGGRLESSLAMISTRSFGDHDLDACRSLAVMLGQLSARLVGERVAARRLAAQHLLSTCAADLAEATPDTLRHVFGELLGRVAEFCELDRLVDWRLDARNRCFVKCEVWSGEGFAGSAVPERLAWDEAPLLDDTRRSGVRNEVVHGTPASARSRLAIPRGEGGSMHILHATGNDASHWPDETVRLLQSLSRMVAEVEARVAVERYAHAAFQGAPIGVLLRDEGLNLVTCNQAFVDFVGADSVDDLVGTLPNEVFDTAAETLEWTTEEDGRITGEAAFHGPGGSQVWGQLRASVVDGDDGEKFWLVHIEDVTERRQAEQLLRFQASHDELTGLANRRRLLEEIDRMTTEFGSVAVLLLDIDRFKNVNDSLGHERGDELLVVVADRLRLAVRPGDLVARLGGDEFAVVLPGTGDSADAEFVAERLQRLIGEPVLVGRQKVYPSVSIGIAVAVDADEVEGLLRRADTAMYQAKADGRARARVFGEELREQVLVRMETESGLRGALQDDELRVHYQPEVSLYDGRVLGAEALVRWQHPTKGLLAASAFIEIAEETGLVVEMSDRVLVEACAEASTWGGGDAAPIVRVNLAAAQLQRRSTVDLVESVLERTGLAPARLCLEITESAVMADVERSEEILRLLKGLGVRLAVDDFGTGFSSLAYLKRFPVDALKIDRAFVSDLGSDQSDRAFVGSIVSLADALGLDVVAEGVETLRQAEILVELGCHRAQGYYFARPGPAEWLRTYFDSGLGLGLGVGG